MTDTKTRVVVEAQTKGFEKATRDTERMGSALEDAANPRAMKQLDGSLGKLNRTLKDLTSAAAGLDRAFAKGGSSDHFRGMAADIKEAVLAMKQLGEERGKQRQAEAQHQQSAGRRGFGMGVMQGAGVGEYFPERGLSANVAGRATGGLARRAGSLAWGSTFGGGFSGASGFAQGLASIPAVGGLLAGQVQNVMAAAQQGYQFHEGAQALNQFRSVGNAKAANAAGEAAARNAPQEDVLAAMDAARGARAGDATASYEGRVNDIVLHRMGKEGFPGSRPPLADGGVAWQQRYDAIAYPLNAKLQANGEGAQKDLASMALAAGNAVASRNDMARRNAASAASGAVRAQEAPNFFGMAQYGMNATEAQQFAGSMLQTAGGGLAQLRGGAMETAAGAQSRFGVQGGTAGLFMRGERLGGSQNGDLVSALAAAVQMGLEGSDVGAAMEETASLLSDFDRTGMPLDIGASMGFRAQVGMAGLGAERGSAVGGALIQTGRAIASNGVQNAAQMAAFQDLYGYGGGGTQDYYDAAKRAEKGQIVEGGLGKLIGRAQGPNTASRSIALQQLLKQVGANVGLEESERLIGADQAGLSRVQAAMNAAKAGGLEFTSADLRGALGAADGAVQTRKGTENIQIGAGLKGLPALEAFERAQSLATKNMAEFSKEMKAVADIAVDLQKAIGPGGGGLAEFLREVWHRVGG